MSGRVFNLEDPDCTLPDVFVVDTNIVVERLSSSIGFRSNGPNEPRVWNFFERILENDCVPLVTPTIFLELAHIVVKLTYVDRLKAYRHAQSQPFGPLSSWTALYKRDPSILKSMRPVLEQLRTLLVSNGLFFTDPDLQSVAQSNKSIDSELIDTMCRFGLDSSDSMILLESRRFGVLDLVSFDLDMIRASDEFRIYTWFAPA